MTTTKKLALILVTLASLVVYTASATRCKGQGIGDDAPTARCSQGYHSWRRAIRGIEIR